MMLFSFLTVTLVEVVTQPAPPAPSKFHETNALDDSSAVAVGRIIQALKF